MTPAQPAGDGEGVRRPVTGASPGPTRSSRGLGGDQGTPRSRRVKTPYLTSIGVSRQQGRAHAIRSRSDPAGVLVDASVNDVQTYQSPVRPRVQGATP